MSGIEVLSRTQRIIVLPHTSTSIVKEGPEGPQGLIGPQGLPGETGLQGASGFGVVAATSPLTHNETTQTIALNIGSNLEVVNGSLQIASLITGNKIFQSTTPSEISLIVKGVGSQTVDLQQWQDLAGVVLSRIAADGTLYGGNIIGSDYLTVGMGGIPIDAAFQVGAQSSVRVGVVIRSAPLQTADLQQWQDSSATTLSRVTAAGWLGVGSQVPLANVEITGSVATGTPSSLLVLSRPFNSGVAFPAIAALALSNPLSSSINTRLDFLLSNANSAADVLPSTTVMSLLSTGNVGIGTISSTGSRLSVVGSVVSDVVIVNKGAVGQTADLQQWQNSAGTVLGALSSAGNLGLGVAPGTARVNLSNKVRLYDTIPDGAIGSTYSGVFVGSSAIPMGFVSEVDLIMSLGVNCVQVGTRNTGSVGGIFRFDTRAGALDVGGNSFIIYGYPIGSGTPTPRIVVSLENGDTSLLTAGGRLLIGNGTEANAGNGSRTIYMANVTVLSTIDPIAGGLFYADNGWMKWRSSSGVIFDTTQQAAIAAPTGGATIDTEARAAIDEIRARLQTMGSIAA